MSFACTRCGACCRVVGAIPEMHAYDRGDGACRHLTDENACAIYEERPALCRVDVSCPPVLQLAEWWKRNEEACGRLRLKVFGQPMGGA